MFGKSTLKPSTSSKNIFGSTTSSSSTSAFGGGQKSSGFGSSSSMFGSKSTAATGQSTGSVINPGADTSNIMYLSSNNQHKYSKLSTFPDNVKAGFHFIANIFENNDRYMQEFKKLYSPDDMAELSEASNEAVKAVKSAWTSLSTVNTQLRSLQNELETNKTVCEEIKLALKTLKEGDEQVDFPSTYFQSLISQFEARLSLYQKGIDEVEELIDSSIQKESERSLMERGVLNDDFGYEGQSDLSNTSLLYQVLQLLYDNFMSVANQVEAISEMVDTRVIKTKRYLERNTNMSLNEIEKLFEYKESESDAMINNLNSLSVRNTEKSILRGLDRLSLDESDTSFEPGMKRRAYETSLISNERRNRRSKLLE